MRTTSASWLDRLQALPAAQRLAAAAGATVAAFALVGLLPTGLDPVHLQMTLLAAVLLAAVLLGLAAGLVGATAGFALLLWSGMDASAGGWSLGWRPVLDAFVWFAVAKLAAALVAAPRAGNRRLAEATRRAEEAAARSGLLLEEWSHRVSNDLYLQVSMLRAQAGSDPDAAPALQAAAGRVQVLGRVHGRLSRGAVEGAIVDSRSFLEGLAGDLRASLGGGARPVTLAMAAEAHVLPLTAAGDIGLVLNELVTNAVKHAFPGNRAGVVRASFRRDGEVFELSVADNGVGMGPADFRDADGVGSQLLRGLATQLGGRIETRAGEVGGTVRTLRFPVPVPGAAPSDGGAGAAITGGNPDPADGARARAAGRQG